MKINIKTIVRLFLGYFLYAVAIVVMINANIGLSPWDAFHQGISIKTGITMGQASITVGSIIVILDAILGENIGWGTVGNMLFIGIFIDLVTFLGIIPQAHSIYTGIIMIVLGVIISAVATVLYLGVGLGSGPRDGLMIAVHKKMNKTMGMMRTIIELTVLTIGWILGGSVGIGTVISALALGWALQILFKLCKLDAKKIKHRFIIDDIRDFKNKNKKKENKRELLENALDEDDI